MHAIDKSKESKQKEIPAPQPCQQWQQQLNKLLPNIMLTHEIYLTSPFCQSPSSKEMKKENDDKLAHLPHNHVVPSFHEKKMFAHII